MSVKSTPLLVNFQPKLVVLFTVIGDTAVNQTSSFQQTDTETRISVAFTKGLNSAHHQSFFWSFIPDTSSILARKSGRIFDGTPKEANLHVVGMCSRKEPNLLQHPLFSNQAIFFMACSYQDPDW